ncbi:MAG TPA: DUF5060 domain-containing protein, partial [Phycisphaerae bacterium]
MKRCSIKMFTVFSGLLAGMISARALAAAPDNPPIAASVERWGTYEMTLKGPEDGNPFVDVTLSAKFTQGNKSVMAAGFYDGAGVYKVRFMPSIEGAWHYETTSNRPELSGKSGDFTCTKASAGGHGPVAVHDMYHFAYADGTRYFELGTTCYGWTQQTDALQEMTVATLKESPFNKIRLCVLNKTYKPGENGMYPFAGPPTRLDFTRFNPAYFQNLEKRVGQLRDLGIEADLILFHP